MGWQQDYLQKYYPPSSWTNGTDEFHQLCSKYIPKGAMILEVGPGPANHTSDSLSTLGRVYGVDVDQAIIGNKTLAEAFVMSDDSYPFEDCTFDACVSNYVIEHVRDEAQHLKEVHRVLKAGGAYIFRTPNIYHYTGFVGRLTPHWVHMKLANWLRNLPPDKSADPYPTYYRLNSRCKIVREANRWGFDIPELRMVEKEPSYGMVMRPLFFAFLAYERIVNSWRGFEGIRANIFAVLKK